MSPAGVVHLQLWKRAWFIPMIISIVLVIFFGKLVVPAGILLGYLLGYYIDPDLDLMGITSSEGRMVKIPILGLLLVTYWTPYGVLFRRKHRSFWTHSYIFSTILRFIYMFWWLLFFKYLPEWVLVASLGIVVGLIISDSIHIWADKVFGGK